MKVVYLNMDETANLPEMRPNEFGSGKWINFGKDNNFPQMVSLFPSYSTVHGGVLKFKVDQVVGGGFEKQPDKLIPDPMFLNKIAKDNEMFNGFYMELIADKKREKIARINHVDFTKIRAGKSENYGEVKFWYYCEKWSSEDDLESTDYKKMPIINYRPEFFSEKYKGKLPTRMLMCVKDYHPNRVYYPLPTYISAVAYIRAAYEIAQHHLNTAHNQFAPSALVFMKGNPSDDEKEFIETAVHDKWQGGKGAGNLIFIYSDAEGQPTIEPFAASSNADLYNNVNEIVTQHIISAHRLPSPTLAGLPGGANNLGSNGQEIATAHDLFFNTITMPSRNRITSTLEGLKANTVVPDADFSIKETKLISPLLRFSEDFIEEVTTEDERRQMIGFEPMSDKERKALEKEKAELVAEVLSGMKTFEVEKK